MPSFTTRGEAFLGRELRREQRAGVEHYALGQHLAQREGTEDGLEVARLSWVSPLGAVGMVVVRPERGGDWRPAALMARVVGLSMDYGMRRLPPTFELTEEMQEALAKLDDEGGAR